MRKWTRNMVAAILSVVALSSVMMGCDAPEKVFTCQDMSITLTTGFAEKEVVGQTAVYQSLDVIVTALKEPFSQLSGAGVTSYSSASDYAKVVISQNKLGTTVLEDNNLTYFTYKKEVSGKNYYYKATIHKGKDAFWMVQFACFADSEAKYDSTFTKYAQSITLA